MRTLRSQAEQEKHRKAMEKCLKEGNFDKFRKIASEHERLLSIREEFVCSEITNRMIPEDKDKANLFLRKICILSDIVEGAGIDLLSLLNKYDPYLSLPLLTLLNNLQKTAHEINKIIDAVGNDEYVASFGDVCDEIDKRIKDLFKKGDI